MKTNKSAASSQPEELTRRSEADIQAYLKSDAFKKDAERLRKHVRAHGGEPSPEDLDEIPLLTEEALNSLHPAQLLVTVHIEADIMAWLKAKGDRYEEHLNSTLRDAMHGENSRTQTR